MKEQLVEMTGLTPRVIRVWFQNKRCKDKKKTVQMKLQIQQEKVNTRQKQKPINPLWTNHWWICDYIDHECPYSDRSQEGRKLGYGSMHGIPMRASSPVRHDSPLNQYGHEVTTYQPPWKALSEFALHSDFETKFDPTAHNPQTIQNLVNQVSSRLNQYWTWI